jgi:transcriptional regulator NrdR family protein
LSDTTTDCDPPTLPLGLVCRECHGAAWKVNTTRPGFACVRRWRVCLRCGHEVRTKEVIEFDGPNVDRAA